MRTFLVGFIMLFGLLAHGATLSQAPFIWNQAKPLQTGQSHFSILSSFQSGHKVYGSKGAIRPLGHASSGAKSWGEVFKSLDRSEQERLEKFLRDEKLTVSSPAIVTEYTMSQQRVQFAPTWAYGLTKKWSLAARMPISLTKTKVNHKTSATKAFQKFSKGTPLKLLPKASGQEGVSSTEEQSETGNFELQSKYSLVEKSDLYFSWSQVVRFATAERRKSSELHEIYTESSKYGLGVGAHLDWATFSRLHFTGSASYLRQLEENLRTENEQGEREKVSVNGGDITRAQIQANYLWLSSWQLNGGVIFQDKQADSSGGQSLPFSKQRWEVVKLGMAYRPQRLSRLMTQKNMTAEFNLYSPVGGEGILTAPTASLEMTLIF